MVLPIIGGAALLGFITFGEKFLGKKTFKKILTILILLGIGIIGYIIYKMYKAWEKAKETAEDTIEDIKDIMEGSWEWVLAGHETIKEDAGWIFRVTPEEFLPDIEKTAEKITPGSYNSTYGKEIIEDISLFEKVYWAPTHVILTSKEKAEDVYNAPRYYWNKLWGK